jgi:hypothetical protein
VRAKAQTLDFPAHAGDFVSAGVRAHYNKHVLFQCNGGGTLT